MRQRISGVDWATAGAATAGLDRATATPVRKNALRCNALRRTDALPKMDFSVELIREGTHMKTPTLCVEAPPYTWRSGCILWTARKWECGIPAQGWTSRGRRR